MESGSLGKKLGQVCLEAFDNQEDEFGKTVIDILEKNMVNPLSKNPCKLSFIRRKLAPSK